jgi:SNF2 family DNA or RNA helicase
VPFFRLDGATKAEDRAAMIAEFNRAGSRPQVFLLSTQAGGEGVNLIGANRTVLFDVSFNPCADGQVNAAL